MSYVASATVGSRAPAPAGAGPEAQAIDGYWQKLRVNEPLRSETWAKVESMRVERERLYGLCRAGRDQEAAQRLLATLDRELGAGNFSDVDGLLTSLDAERLGPSVLLAALTISSYAKPFLRHRDTFLTRAEEQLRARLGATRTAALLALRR